MESDMTDGDGGPTNFSNKNFDGAVEITEYFDRY